jgi:hypothetical protein
VVRAEELFWKLSPLTRESARVEAGSNTSTVTLRVVGGDEKGSLKYETVIYGREYQRTRTRETLRWQEPAANTKDRPVLPSERAPHKKQDSNCQKIINIWSQARDGARYQHLLTYWPSIAMWLWLWLTREFLSECGDIQLAASLREERTSIDHPTQDIRGVRTACKEWL